MTKTLSEGHRNRNRLTLAESFHWIHFRKKIVADDKCQSGAIYAVLRQLFGISPPRVRKLLRLTLDSIKNAKVVGSFFHKHCQRHNDPDSRNRVILDLSNLATWTICHISWDCYLLELLSSSARVTSIKSQQGLRLRSGRMYGSPWTRSVLWHFASLPSETQPPVLSLQNIICAMKINSPNRLYSGRIG